MYAVEEKVLLIPTRLPHPQPTLGTNQFFTVPWARMAFQQPCSLGHRGHRISAQGVQREEERAGQQPTLRQCKETQHADTTEIVPCGAQTRLLSQKTTDLHGAAITTFCPLKYTPFPTRLQRPRGKGSVTQWLKQFMLGRVASPHMCLQRPQINANFDASGLRTRQDAHGCAGGNFHAARKRL